MPDIPSIFRAVNREVWVVTAADGARRGGLLATWVMQASIDPQRPMVVAGLAPNHFTAELVEASQAFALHLPRSNQAATALSFAIGSGRARDKLADIASTPSPQTGNPLLADCLAWLDCRVIDRWDIGDRLIFLADVVAGQRLGDGEPLCERELIAAASDEQRGQLSRDMAGDIEQLRRLADLWRARRGTP